MYAQLTSHSHSRALAQLRVLPFTRPCQLGSSLVYHVPLSSQNSTTHPSLSHPSDFGNRLDRCQECTPLPRPLDLPAPFGGSIPLLLATLASPLPSGADRALSAIGIGWDPALGAGPAYLCKCEPTQRICLPPDADDLGDLEELSAAPYLVRPETAQSLAASLEAGCLLRPPTANFDTFANALLTTFQITTGEAWYASLPLEMPLAPP